MALSNIVAVCSTRCDSQFDPSTHACWSRLLQAQPYNSIVGNAVGCFVGVSCYKLVGKSTNTTDTLLGEDGMDWYVAQETNHHAQLRAECNELMLCCFMLQVGRPFSGVVGAALLFACRFVQLALQVIE